MLKTSEKNTLGLCCTSLSAIASENLTLENDHLGTQKLNASDPRDLCGTDLDSSTFFFTVNHNFLRYIEEEEEGAFLKINKLMV